MADNLEQRVSALESWKTTVAVSIGKQEVDREYINKKFNEIEAELKDIKKVSRNLMYTAYAAIVTYIVKFVVSGGLSTPSIM